MSIRYRWLLWQKKSSTVHTWHLSFSWGTLLRWKHFRSRRREILRRRTFRTSFRWELHHPSHYCLSEIFHPLYSVIRFAFIITLSIIQCILCWLMIIFNKLWYQNLNSSTILAISIPYFHIFHGCKIIYLQDQKLNSKCVRKILINILMVLLVWKEIWWVYKYM